MKRTLIIGASTNPERYSYKAAHKLTENGHEICMIGPRQGELCNTPIHTDLIPFENIHTVTLYVSAKNQIPYYDYIIQLHPQRVIFNPGTENEEFAKKLESLGIIPEVACTLVLLSTNMY
ncbi:MAG TPA: CoA-binding protein [Bacteroidales bacterium]|jgi:hypothetical protein|nr:CoA-binding protein [Bacteroidales bacterium]HRS18268.1 CoA-binding protein [Bacteroidales bacterium]